MQMIDIVFIDAAKQFYIEFYELVLPKLNKGGLIIADNVLWKGMVGTDESDKLGIAIHNFNIHVSKDPRVENIILPLRDGLQLIRKL